MKLAYDLLQCLDLEEPIPMYKILWQGVVLFGWRVLWGRIQTKQNLDKRIIIPAELSLVCVFCLDKEESLEHLLFTCPFSYQVWSSFYKWLGVSTVLPENYWQHFLQHSAELGSLYQRQGDTIDVACNRLVTLSSQKHDYF